MRSSSRDLDVPGKPDAVFSCHIESSQNTYSERDQSNESGHRFNSAFRFMDPANIGKSLLVGNKDHLLSQPRSELMMQEHQVGSLTKCINELQQQAYAQRLELQDAQHGYIISRRQQVLLQEELSLKEKVLRYTQIRSMADQHKSHRSKVMSTSRLSSKTSRPKRSSLKTSSPEELSLTGILGQIRIKFMKELREILLQKIWMNLEKLVQPRLTSSHRCTPITT